MKMNIWLTMALLDILVVTHGVLVATTTFKHQLVVRIGLDITTTSKDKDLATLKLPVGWASQRPNFVLDAPLPTLSVQQHLMLKSLVLGRPATRMSKLVDV